MVKLFLLSSCILLLFISSSCNLFKIADEVINANQLAHLVNEFNIWHRHTYPKSTKVEVRIRPQGGIGVFALSDIKVNKHYKII
jgi:hypothetical protein